MSSPMARDLPILFSAPMVRSILADEKTQTRRIVKGAALEWLKEFTPDFVADPANHLCPYGPPGRRLWVRETWAQPILSQSGNRVVVYAAADNRTDYGGPWKPSIFMPRWASRITLEVTGVRVEQLQRITSADALAEGARPTVPGFHGARGAFIRLWESINGHGSWDLNPWCWAISFRRLPSQEGTP